MKIKMYPNLLLTFIVLLLQSCGSTSNFLSAQIMEDDESLTFSYEYVVGGRLGGHTSLNINADSTYYSSYSRVLQSPEVKTFIYETTAKTSDEQWNYLIKRFNLETFIKIRSGKCGTCVDGVDEIFSVTVDGDTYSFTNGSDDWYYQEIKDFFDSVKKISTHFGKGKHKR